MIAKMPEINNGTDVLNKALKQFKESTKTPEIYLRQQNERAEKNKLLVKSLYDFAKLNENFNLCKGREKAVTNDAPTELILDHMDEEQIWQQLELQNNTLWQKCLQSTSKILSTNDERFELKYRCAGEEDDDQDFEDEEQSEEELESQDHGEDSEITETSDNESDGDSDAPKKSSKSKSDLSADKPGRSSIVDDKFFKLSEMEAFLDSEDKKEMLKLNGKPDPEADSEDEIDYFNGNFSSEDENEEDEVEEDDDSAGVKYSDFFAEGRQTDDEDEDERKARMRKERQERYKLKAKRNKADLGFEDSDLDDVEDEELEQLDDEEGGSEEESDDDEKGDSSKRSIKFDLSKNEYRSDSEIDGSEGELEGDGEQPNELDEEEKSAFQLRQERLRNRIADMEEAALGEKSWQLRGEVDSASRPKNSLLEEVLEFDSTTRPAPIITEETTLRLEDIIKQRIKDKAWDDVERKIKPLNEPQEFRKTLVLNQEKSKESLAQIYEKDYLKAMDKLNPNKDVLEKADEPKEHKEIREQMRALFVKLDALSNFFYTPKPVAPEAKIITNTPAINMEEVAPVGVSDAALLAPEEVKARPKGDVIGRTERTRTDKNRERRQKKVKQQRIHKAAEKKDAEKAKLGITSSTKEEQKKLMAKVTKGRNVLKMKETTDGGKSLKSSKAFFNQLQDQVAATKSKKATKTKRNDSLQNEKSAKRFKL